MRYAFDLDNTLCLTRAGDYLSSSPIASRIEKVNKLYDLGHNILIYTARGSSTGIDWREHTEKQLSMWGVRYHELRLDKAEYDVFIDDKAIDVISFFNHDVAHEDNSL